MSGLMHGRDIFLIRIVLATVWIVTGVLSLGVYPQQESLKLLEEVGLYDETALFMLYSSATLDILLGVLTLSYPVLWLWRAQAAVVIVYSLIITIGLPSFLLHPFGPVLKNLPILLLLWLLSNYQRKIS